MKRIYLLAVVLAICGTASAQYVRKDVTLQDALGRAMPQATVYVCTQPCTSNTIPPSPLATIYSTAAGAATLLPGQVSTDGLGNSYYYFDPNGAPYTEVYVWHGVIVKVLPDQDSFGSTGGGTSFSCTGALNGSIMAVSTSGTTHASCDPLIGTDFSGHGFSQSWATLGAYNGFFEMKGGAASPGTNATFKMGSNAFRWLVPTTVTTSYYTQVPGTYCAVGQVWQVTGVTSDGNGDPVMAFGCLTPSALLTLKTNGTTNSSQTLLNLQQGTGINLSESGGTVTITNTGTAAPQALNPTAPTVTPTGTPGATNYSYVIQGCEDGPTCANHSAPTAAGSTTTGNASLSTTNYNLLTLYAGTLYGYRCYNVYRTVGGATQGKIATCVWKQFADTGQAGDGTTAPTGNTTVLDANGTTAPLPGCNKIPSAPWGIDGPPCTPKATDDEFTWGNGGTNVPGDAADQQWKGRNLGTSTLTLTNGELIFAPQPGANVDAWRLLNQTPPSTPYTFVATMLMQATNGSNNQMGGVCIDDGTKFDSFEQWSNAGTHEIIIQHWSTVSGTNVAVYTLTLQPIPEPWVYWKIQNTGVNLVFSHSFDGINYIQDYSEAVGSFLGAITGVGLCAESTQTAATPAISYDYWRQTQ